MGVVKPRSESDPRGLQTFAQLQKFAKPIAHLLLRPADMTEIYSKDDKNGNAAGKNIMSSPLSLVGQPATTLEPQGPFMPTTHRKPASSTLLPVHFEKQPVYQDVSDSYSLPDNISVSRGGHGRSETTDTVVAPSTPTGEPLSDSKSKEHDPNHRSRPGLSEEIEDLVAVTSEEYQRYERNETTEKYYWDKYWIDPMESDFSRSVPGSVWKSHIHPEGFLYFHNDSWNIPILTDVYVYDSDGDLLKRLEDYIAKVFEYVKNYDLQHHLPKDICLVLEFRNSRRCGYYFVDHTSQCLFWLDEFDAMDFLSPVRVDYTPSLVYHEMKALYWLHNEYFPDMRPFPTADILELKDIILHAIGDSLTSSSSTAPYNIESLTKMLEVVEKIEGLKSASPKSVTIIYRLLYNFYHEKFLQLHGERQARLNAEQSIHPARPKTWLIKLMSPVLLYGPEVHLRKLKEISVDSLVKGHRWTSFLQQLTDEWKEFTLYATVLLNANVAFLAIQSVDSSAPPHGRSALQRASYFSIVTSIGAIILGLLLVRQHNTTLDRSFLANRSASTLGLETLALMYSLPYALLLWGFVSFLSAFSLMCFSSHDVLTIVMITICGAILLLLLLWSVSASFEEKPFWNLWIFRKMQFPTPIEGVKAGEGRLKQRDTPSRRLYSTTSSNESNWAVKCPKP